MSMNGLHTVTWVSIPHLYCIISRAWHEEVTSREELNARDFMIMPLQCFKRLMDLEIPKFDGLICCARRKYFTIRVKGYKVNASCVTLKSILEFSLLIIPELYRTVFTCWRNYLINWMKSNSSDSLSMTKQSVFLWLPRQSITDLASTTTRGNPSLNRSCPTSTPFTHMLFF